MIRKDLMCEVDFKDCLMLVKEIIIKGVRGNRLEIYYVVCKCMEM